MRPRPAPWRAAAPALLGAALVLGAAACTQPTPRPPAGTLLGTVEVLIQPTILPLDPEATTEPTPGPADSAATDDGHEDPFDASDLLKDGRCTHAGDSWNFTGTMTNPDSTKATYTIGITLLATKDLSAVFTKELTVTVPAGGSVPVAAKDFHRASADGLTCLTGVTIKED